MGHEGVVITDNAAGAVRKPVGRFTAMNRITGLLVVACVLVALVVVGDYSYPSADAAESAFTAVVERGIVEFGDLGKPVRMDAATFRGNRQVVEVQTDAGKTVWVDAQGRVVGVVGLVRAGKPGANLDKVQAMRVAREFLSQQHPAFNEMVLQEDYQSEGGSYHFGWRMRAGSGAWLTEYASIAVISSTGALASYHATFEPTEADAEPRLTEAQIRSIWNDAPGRTDDTIEVVELRVVSDKNGVQRLVYLVVYTERIAVGSVDGVSDVATVMRTSAYDAVTGVDVTELLQ